MNRKLLRRSQEVFIQQCEDGERMTTQILSIVNVDLYMECITVNGCPATSIAQA